MKNAQKAGEKKSADKAKPASNQKDVKKQVAKNDKGGARK